MKNNKGFSLVELIIAFALLLIISTSVIIFMRVSSHAYYSVSTSVNLQVKTQMAATQLQNYIIDCNGGILYSSDGTDDTLYIINAEDRGYVAHIFRFNPVTGELLYGKNSVETDGSTASLQDTTPDLLARDCKEFSVVISSPSSVNLKLVLSRNGKTQESTQTIFLRNRPSTAGTLSELLAAVCLN